MASAVLRTSALIVLLLSGVKLREITPPTINEIIQTVTENIDQTTETQEIPLLSENTVEEQNEDVPEENKRGRCVCAVFDAAEEVSNNSQPIFAHPIAEVECDKTGQDKCSNICMAGAGRARGIGASIFCSILGHVEKLKVSLFSNICDAVEYSYTGFTDDKPICCHDGLVVDCEGAENYHRGHIC